MYCPQQLVGAIEPKSHIIDARAGCGTRIPQLSAMVGKHGHIFAFENRPGRVETLRLNIKQYGCQSKCN